MNHILTISLIVNNFFSLVLLLSLSICNNHLDLWIAESNAKVTNSDILSIQFNMVRYNKVNPFKKMKDKKPYQFKIDRSSRFYLQANNMISIFNGDTLVSHNKKSNQSLSCSAPCTQIKFTFLAGETFISLRTLRNDAIIFCIQLTCCKA